MTRVRRHDRNGLPRSFFFWVGLVGYGYGILSNRLIDLGLLLWACEVISLFALTPVTSLTTAKQR